jgi:hypothetical protein
LILPLARPGERSVESAQGVSARRATAPLDIEAGTMWVSGAQRRNLKSQNAEDTPTVEILDLWRPMWREPREPLEDVEGDGITSDPRCWAGWLSRHLHAADEPLGPLCPPLLETLA